MVMANVQPTRTSAEHRHMAIVPSRTLPRITMALKHHTTQLQRKVLSLFFPSCITSTYQPLEDNLFKYRSYSYADAKRHHQSKILYSCVSSLQSQELVFVALAACSIFSCVNRYLTLDKPRVISVQC